MTFSGRPMRAIFLWAAFAPWVTGISEAAEMLLAEAAKIVAKDLPAGCIVTAERKGSEVAFALAGKAEPADAKPESLLFEIGSITKTFTGLLLAQAVVEGKVKLDTTVAELLAPQATFADPRIGAITLEQLSTHTSGLPRLPDNTAAGMAAEDPYARYDAKLLLAYLSTAKLEGQPPYRASYSNLGVGLLGHLLSRAYGRPWEALIVEKICLPLGMNETRMDITASKLTLATPYAGKKKVKPWTFDTMAGAGALRSTAADIMRYGDAILHPERTPLKDAFAIALKPHAEWPSNSGDIGLGFIIAAEEGRIRYEHGGGTGGYRTLLQVIPATETVRVVLINNASEDGGTVVAKAKGQAPKQPAINKKEIVLPGEPLRGFEGVYEVDNETRFTVLWREGVLWCRLSGQPFFRIFPSQPDRFFLKVVEAEITFQKEGDKVVSLTLFQNGNRMQAERTAKPVPSVIMRPAKELQEYAGGYSLMGLTDLTVTLRSQTLFAQIKGQPAFPVYESAKDTFDLDVVEAKIVFTRDAEGKVSGIILNQNGMAVPAPRKAAAKK